MKKQLGPSPWIFPMPAVLIGSYGEDGTPNAMTAAWASACCHTPPCLGVAIRSPRLTRANIAARGAFTVNVPSAALAAKVDSLGIVSGKRIPDKLTRLGVVTERSTEVDAPLLSDCPVNVECRLTTSVQLGTHAWVVGEVAQVHADGAVIGSDGKIDIEALDPLAYFPSAREYRAVGRVIGAAFEMGKGLL